MKRKPTKKELLKELIARRRVGAMLANCAYNLSQKTAQLDAQDCKSLKETQQAWDAIGMV